MTNEQERRSELRVKSDCVDDLCGIGISREHAVAITGQPCKSTGRRGINWTQVEFSGALIGWNEPFVFCVPNGVLDGLR